MKMLMKSTVCVNFNILLWNRITLKIAELYFRYFHWLPIIFKEQKSFSFYFCDSSIYFLILIACELGVQWSIFQVEARLYTRHVVRTQDSRQRQNVRAQRWYANKWICVIGLAIQYKLRNWLWVSTLHWKEISLLHGLLKCDCIFQAMVLHCLDAHYTITNMNRLKR